MRAVVVKSPKMPATIVATMSCQFLILVALVPAGLLAAEPVRGDGRTWHVENGFKWAELSVPAGGKTGFTLLSAEQTGIYFTNELAEWKGEANRVLFNGSGLAAGDFDNDGLPDLYFCSLQGRNALYKNLGGGAFKNVTAESGIVCPGQNYRGAVFADVNEAEEAGALLEKKPVPWPMYAVDGQVNMTYM